MVRETVQDVRTLITGDHTTGGDEPVVVFEPFRAIGIRQGRLTTEMQAFGIVPTGFGRATWPTGRSAPPGTASNSGTTGGWAQAPRT